MQLHELGITEARQKLIDKEITSFELTKSLLERIEKFDSNIGAFITINKDDAFEQAKKADKDIANNNSIIVVYQ